MIDARYSLLLAAATVPFLGAIGVGLVVALLGVLLTSRRSDHG